MPITEIVEVGDSSPIVSPNGSSAPNFAKDIANILGSVRPYIRSEPYLLPDFELTSPISEYRRELLIHTMLNLSYGPELFRQSNNLAFIAVNAASHKALERMYKGPIWSIEADEDNYLWARLFIENIHNSMAVRNRLKIVNNILSGYIKGRLYGTNDEVNILGIAAGSSRAVIKTLAESDRKYLPRIKYLLTDASRDAIKAGEDLANQFKVRERVATQRSLFQTYPRYLLPEYRADFVEIVGLTDYLSPSQIIDLLSTVRSYLTPNGVVLFSNIAANDEGPTQNDNYAPQSDGFVHKIVGWQPMYYRSANDLVDLARRSGFRSRVHIPEPLGVYNLILASG